MDVFTPKKRSRIMSRIGSKNTEPELIIRKMLYKLGYRFRLHRKDLPGKPDIVLPRYKTAIFIHGCFWHGHDCKRGKRPSSNREFWEQKISGNMVRDMTNLEKLKLLGWNPLVIWQCEIKDKAELEKKFSLSLPIR